MNREEALKHLDTDGSAIEMGEKMWRTKGQQEKAYQTAYGEVVVERHIYQSAGGGKTYCPMEKEARIVSSFKFKKGIKGDKATRDNEINMNQHRQGIHQA